MSGGIVVTSLPAPHEGRWLASDPSGMPLALRTACHEAVAAALALPGSAAGREPLPSGRTALLAHLRAMARPPVVTLEAALVEGLRGRRDGARPREFVILRTLDGWATYRVSSLHRMSPYRRGPDAEDLALSDWASLDAGASVPGAWRYSGPVRIWVPLFPSEGRWGRTSGGPSYKVHLDLPGSAVDAIDVEAPLIERLAGEALEAAVDDIARRALAECFWRASAVRAGSTYEVTRTYAVMREAEAASRRRRGR